MERESTNFIIAECVQGVILHKEGFSYGLIGNRFGVYEKKLIK